MRDDFTFDCPKCDNKNQVNRTSSGEPVPHFSDEAKSFYVTCPHCYSIFRVEDVVVLTEAMFSNFKSKNKDSIAGMSVTGIWFDEFKDYIKGE